MPPLTPAPGLPQSVAALRYRVYDRPVDLAPLVVRQVRLFTWGAARVSAYILGASHALTVDLPDGQTVTELLTCLPPRGMPESTSGSALENEWAIPTLVGESVNMTFAHGGICGAGTLTRFALADTSDRLSGAFEANDTLHEPFPARPGETAWTRVGWRREGPLLYVETIHTYPEEGTGIRSATCFSLSELTLTDGPKR